MPGIINLSAYKFAPLDNLPVWRDQLKAVAAASMVLMSDLWLVFLLSMGSLSDEFDRGPESVSTVRLIRSKIVLLYRIPFYSWSVAV